MKHCLILCLSTFLCSSVALASPFDIDQQTTDRPRRVELPSFLGVQLREVSGETVSRLKLREERGALIEGVTSGSGAAQAGLQRNDVIVKWDGQPIESARELSRHIRETPPGRTVRLTLIRDGREIEVNVTLGERNRLATRARIARPAVANVRVRPDVMSTRGRNKHLGIELQSMTPQLAEYFGLSKRSGALVIFVFADSPAAKAGLKAGDVILSAGGETVENPIELQRVLIDKPEGEVEFKILRDRREQSLKVKLEKGTSSWLLAPDESWDGFQLAFTAPVFKLPKLAKSPRFVFTMRPSTIQVPRMEIAPLVVPKLKLSPMKLVRPKIKIEPVEIPKIKIEPMKMLIVPRRIVL